MPAAKSMTSRDNFYRMGKREQPQRLPVDVPLTPPVRDMVERQTGIADPVNALDLDFRGVGPRFPNDAAKWRRAFAELGVDLPANSEIGFAGVTHVPPPPESLGKAYHFRQMLHPLETVTSIGQLSALPWPNIDSDAPYAELADQVRRIHDEGRVAVGRLECTVFELAWYLRGMENLFGDLIEGNGVADWLFDWFTHRAIAIGRAYARAGCDVIALGDDVGTQRGMMMSVDFWREHLRPRLKRVIDAIRSEKSTPVQIRYHSDGDIRPIIPDLIELGINWLNPIQPECMPADELIEQYRGQIGFWGLIGTQSVMPFGTPAEVVQMVRRCATWAAEGAAIVVSPTHVLEPDVPWENIQALISAIRETKLVRS